MNKKLLFAVATATICTHILGTNIISFFMQPFPNIIDEKKAQEKTDKLTRPGKLAGYTLKNVVKDYLTSGIFCTYGGYLTSSDLNGQVIFPRRYKTPKVQIIIAKRIIPIIMLQNTIHHWEVEENISVESYLVVRKQEEEAEAVFWDVKKIKSPKDNIIPLKSIVILANPKYVVIPTGITLTTNSDQYILPDIYIKSGINKTGHILYALGIDAFFQAPEPDFKKDKKLYREHTRG